MSTVGRVTDSSGGNCAAIAVGMFAFQNPAAQAGYGILFSGQGLPSKRSNYAATRMDARFHKATVAPAFLALFAPAFCR